MILEVKGFNEQTYNVRLVKRFTYKNERLGEKGPIGRTSDVERTIT